MNGDLRLRRGKGIAEIALCIATAVLPSTTGRAAEPAKEIPAELILERFAITRAGDGLFIPVRFSGRDHLSLVDTGSSSTIFDESLPLTEPTGAERVAAPGEELVLKTY